MTTTVVLLSPSRGLGGGIERYLQTLEWALRTQGVECHRIDLGGPGATAHARMLADARRYLRARKSLAVRVVAAHPSLLPVASLLAGERSVSGICVICHGSDVWSTRHRARRTVERRLMRRSDVRVVAVSSFTAGVLRGWCPATVLPPALCQEWFHSLVAASAGSPRPARHEGIQLVTAFRLDDWRDKGLPEVLQAVSALNRPDVNVVVCGSGSASQDMLRMMSGYPNCTLRVGLSDRELADQMAAADLFVLATRTRHGRQASGEGFGLVLLEAQVAGTPVVSPAFGGSHDAFLNEVTGVAPTDESPAALARTLDSVLADPVRLARMGRRAAEWARESYAPEGYPPLVTARLL